MASSALVFWLITALGGSYMAGTAVAVGRPVGEAANTHWPSWLTFVHPTTAVLFASMWLVFMNNGSELLAWISLGVLLAAAGLGDVLFLIWHKDHKAEKVALAGGPVQQVRNYVPTLHQGVVQQEAPAMVPVTELVEQRIPVIGVWFHAFSASVTMLLVLLACLGIGV